jgi:branched-chain amino acid transport system substrate-binding protein
MKSILTRLMTAAAVIGMLATVPHVKAADPIKIVALYNLSAGGLASIDGPSLNGAKLMAKQISDAGGLLGGRMIELTAIDTKNDLKEAATGAKRAVSMEGVVAGIGHSDTTFALASAPLFQAQGLPFVTSGATSPDLPDMIGGEMFLACFADDVQAHAMAEYAYNTLGIHNIVMWTDNAMDYTKGLSKYFQDRFTKLGGKVLLNDIYMTEDKDFSALVSRLKANPDAQGVFASSGPDTAGIIIKQIREAGIKLPILGGDGYDTELVSTVPGPDLSDNVYFTTHAYVGLDTGTAKAFREAYQKEFGNPPENAFAALGYDAMGLVADAIKRAGSTDAAAITKALNETTAYPAVTGQIAFKNGSRIPSKPVAIMYVDHGKVNLKTTVTPQG